MSLYHEIALTQIKNLGPRRIRVLLDVFGDAEAVFEAPRDAFVNVESIGKYLFDQRIRDDAFRKAEKEIRFIESKSIKALHYKGNKYPVRLAQCQDAPIILYVCGTDDLNVGRYVAVVGTRRATAYGRNLAENFVCGLSEKLTDITVVSGLAAGIDVFAHKSALENNVRTIGVVAHGLDMIYPSSHRSVAADIISKGGAIVTEYLSNTVPEASNFVQRNRIIAGLSDATVVVESAIKGGALITAGLAGSYSRDVFAFPGRVGDDSSAGCNMLIRSMQAGLIESAYDLIKAERWEISGEEPVQTALNLDLPEEQKKVVDALAGENLHIADLALKVNMNISMLSPILLELEMNGIIESLAGGRYRTLIR